MLQSILRVLSENLQLIPGRLHVLLNPDKAKHRYPGYPVMAGWPEWLPKPAVFPQIRVHIRGVDPRSRMSNNQ